MDLKTGVEVAGFILLVMTNLVVIVSVFTGIRKDVGFLRSLYTDFVHEHTRQITRLDGLHQRHFDHAANTGIHQESMSKETLGLHFASMEASIKGVADQFHAHTDEDMGVFRDIRSDLKEIRDRLPSGHNKTIAV